MAVLRNFAGLGFRHRFRPAMVCVGLLISTGQACGQSPQLPPDGRSRLGGPLQPTQAPDTADREHRERANLTAARLLSSARTDIAEGRPEVAQRILEVLIARYPESSSAGDARRQLYMLYAGDQRIATRPTGMQTAPRSPQAAAKSPLAAEAQRPAASTSSDRTESGWRISTTSYRRLQDQLRNSVGDRIFFSGGSAELGSRARAVIAAQAEWLQQRPDVVAVIEGHADDAMVGADDESLSASRSAAVHDRLVAEGVMPDRLRLAPQGARDRVAVCNDSDCAAQNRRAVVQVAVRPTQQPDISTPTAASAKRPIEPAR